MATAIVSLLRMCPLGFPQWEVADIAIAEGTALYCHDEDTVDMFNVDWLIHVLAFT
jgi:hypothetical protein